MEMCAPGAGCTLDFGYCHYNKINSKAPDLHESLNFDMPKLCYLDLGEEDWDPPLGSTVTRGSGNLEEQGRRGGGGGGPLSI